MTEIYVKSQAYDGNAFCSVAVCSPDGTTKFYDHSFSGAIKTRVGICYQIAGFEANYLMELWAVTLGVVNTTDTDIVIYTHHRTVARWLNGGKAPDYYSGMLDVLHERLNGRRVCSEPIDYGENSVMNTLLDWLLKTKRKIA